MTWPTFQLLSNLKTGWTNRDHEKLVTREDWPNLPPFDELQHPAIQAAQGYASNPSSDKFKEHKEATRVAGYKVIEARDRSKGPGWRTALINMHDATWAVFADHHDKFHNSVGAAFSNKNSLEPTDRDVAIRKIKLTESQSVVAIENWQRQMIRAFLDLFHEAYVLGDKDLASITKVLPEPHSSLLGQEGEKLNVTVSLTVVRDTNGPQDFDDAHQGETDEIEVGLDFSPWKIKEEFKDLILTTILPVLDPDEHKWSSHSAYYDKDNNMCFSFSLSAAKVSQLIFAAEFDGDSNLTPVEPQPTPFAHYAEAGEITASIVEKRTIRSLCGFWFVASRLPDDLPLCRECYDALPEASNARRLLKLHQHTEE